MNSLPNVFGLLDYGIETLANYIFQRQKVNQ